MTRTAMTPQEIGAGGRAMIALAKRFNPVLMPIANRGIIGLIGVIRHRGRRSGRTYETPIAIRPVAGGFVIPLPYGETTDWCSNVLAAGRAVVTVRGKDHDVAGPEVIDRATASDAYPVIIRPMLRAFGISRFLRVREV